MKFSPFSQIEASPTVAINSLALAKKAQGVRVYNLSAGEPMLPPHPAVVAAAEKALQEGKTLYPPTNGIPELRSAADNWMNTLYDTRYTINETLVTCGGKFGLFGLCEALIQPGDKAMVIAPFWVSYTSMVRMFGGETVIVETSEIRNWKLEIGELEKSYDEKVKILFFNNAGNPTGALYSREEIKNILAWAKEHEVLVISDEVYSGLTYNGEFVSCGSFPEYQDNVVVIQSCSKHFAMTGWRVGFVFGAEEIIKVLGNIQSQSTTGTASISQWAAVGAFEHADEIIPWVRGEMQKRRDALVGALKEHFGIDLVIPAGLYAFVSMQNLGVPETDSVAFCKRVLEEANVALVPGAAFGMEGYVRMSFGEREEELREAVKVLSKFVKKYIEV